MSKIKIKHPENRVFISSDWHKFHAQDFIYAARGFDSVEAHSAHIDSLIDNIPEQSILFYNGDLCLNCTEEAAFDILTKLSARFSKVYFTFGNHDHRIKRIAANPELKSQLPNIEFHDYLEVEINKKLCVFFHYPLAAFNGESIGGFALVGHSHNSYPLSRPDNFEKKMLDCSLDGNGNQMWTFDKIRELMRRKGIQSVDHHKEQK